VHKGKECVGRKKNVQNPSKDSTHPDEGYSTQLPTAKKNPSLQRTRKGC
jgi:hypothetical protein